MTGKITVTISEETRDSIARFGPKEWTMDQKIRALLENWREKNFKTGPSVHRCRDNLPKKHRLVFDGGPTGEYILELCKVCYYEEDKRFLIREEPIP